MNRRAARELAMKVLFQWDLVPCRWEKALAYLAEEEQISGGLLDFAEQLVRGVTENAEELDEIIGRYTRDWRLERLATVDRAILRLGLYEILHRDDIPIRVSINEAVELAKVYGTNDSSRFINGLLGQYVREGLPEEVLTRKDSR